MYFVFVLFFCSVCYFTILRTRQTKKMSDSIPGKRSKYYVSIQNLDDDVSTDDGDDDVNVNNPTMINLSLHFDDDVVTVVIDAAYVLHQQLLLLASIMNFDDSNVHVD